MTLDMQFGNYMLIEEIGSGGFGTVYKAEDNIGRIVAIKVLKPSYGGDPATIERFRREAQAAGELFHENIATIIEFGETEGRFYLVMRYVDGLPLNSLIDREGRLPWNQALKIIQDIGAALEYAHKRGFVHRDIKPANILVGETEGAVLTDFGLVRAAEAIGLTSTGVTMGTPNYIAPEIWEGEDVSSATDVYSLACVMFEMLTGTKLFDGETTPKIMKQHVMEGPQLPDQWSEGIPVNLNTILCKGLAIDRTQRYDQVSDFVTALKTGTISKESSDAPKQTPKPQRKSTLIAEKPKKRSRTFRWVFGCGVLSILILVGAGVVLMRSVFRTVEPTSVVVAVKETSMEVPKNPTRTPVPSATQKPSTTPTDIDDTPTITHSATLTKSITPSIVPSHTSSPTLTLTATPLLMLPFSDNFDNGQSSEWGEERGTWVMIGGEYTITGIVEDEWTTGVSTIGDPKWKDYAVRVDVNLRERYSCGTNSAGIIVRAQDVKNYLVFMIYDGQGCSTTNRIGYGTWFVVDEDEWTEISNTRVTGYPRDEEFGVEVRVEGNLVKTLIDGEEESSFTNTWYTTGKAGLLVRSYEKLGVETASFDDFSIEAIEMMTSSPIPDVVDLSGFSDNFDNGQSSEWGEERGTWVMIGGEYTITGIVEDEWTTGVSTIGDPKWKDYAVRVDVNLRERYSCGTNSAGIIVRAQDVKNYLVFMIYDGQGCSTTNRIGYGTWFVVDEDEWTEISNTRVTGYPRDEEFGVEVRVEGNLVKTLIDGEEESSFTNTWYTTGKAGLLVRSYEKLGVETASFDDFSIEFMDKQ